METAMVRCNKMMVKLQEANQSVVCFLNSHGYDRDNLSMTNDKSQDDDPDNHETLEGAPQPASQDGFQGQRSFKYVELRVTRVKVKVIKVRNQKK